MKGRTPAVSGAPPVTGSIKKGIGEVFTAHDDMVEVQLGDQVWLVAKDMIGPIGINRAASLAKEHGMELPSPELADAIWRTADMKLLPMPRNNVISQAVFDDQARKIAVALSVRPYRLSGGAFKDTVNFRGHNEIYGWHVEDGKTVAGVPLLKAFTPGPGRIIQPLSGKHHDLSGPDGFIDYAGGARLVKRIR
jgi:hypothetical protein